jgi:RND superfamily putative drug exporter
VLAWIIACLLILPATSRIDRSLDVAARVDGSESELVERLLAERFATPFAHFVVLVVTGVPAPSSPEGERVLRDVLDSLRTVPGVTGTFSYLDRRDSLLRGRFGEGTFAVIGLDPHGAAVDALVAPLRARAVIALASLRERYPRAALRVTGEVALNHDLRITSAEDAHGAEQRVLPLTLVLLGLAFGAVVAALLPVLGGILAIALSLGIAVLLARFWTLSLVLQNVVTMLGLGLGIDYALLTVSRFRESLAAGRSSEEAALEAADHAGRTIVLSGAAVAIGFLALLLVPLGELRSIAIGGVLVVVTSVAFACTLLPALLVSLGRRIDYGRLRARGVSSGDRWRRWGGWVTRRPALVLVVAGLPVVTLALQARRLSTEVPRGDWLPPRMESARGVRDLRRMGRSGVIEGIRVLVELPPGTSALDDRGWQAVRRVGASLALDRRIARVQSLPTIVPVERIGPVMLSLLPAAARRPYVSRDERIALVELMPDEEIEFAELTHLVRELRAADAGALTGVPGARFHVGGMAAFNVDYENAVGESLPRVVALVVVGTLVALFIGFRSLLVPVKAVALNLLSVAAAYGAVVLVFQDGYGARLLGLDGPVGGTFPAVPLVVFCIVFGLSMDYEVFLVARVAEARRGGSSETEAVIEGLARTGGVITSAAAIMIVVFAAFTLGDFLLMKILGFALAVAVLLDATIVRIAIGPALLRLAGQWNWWPGEKWEKGKGERARR